MSRKNSNRYGVRPSDVVHLPDAKGRTRPAQKEYTCSYTRY